MLKSKYFLFLLLLLATGGGLTAQAQTGRDTTYTLYFNTNKDKTDTVQQKAFKAFLQRVQRIKIIHGYTDTTGALAHNEELSLGRCYAVYNLLPPALHPGVEIVAHAETNSYPQLWQNRRVDVVATLLAKDTAQPTAPGETVAELNIENILFIPDQPVITDESLVYVQQLAQQLQQQYKTEKFEIVGHVNYPNILPATRLKDLYELSEKRAKAVYDLLVQHGIAAQRMQYKGVGNSQPAITNPVTEGDKRKNMRVQIFVIK